MSIDQEIREQISRYLDGRIDAADLEDWISVEAWDIDKESPSTRQLGYDTLRFIAEAQNGEWTDDELREHLGALIRTDTRVGNQFLEQLAVAEERRRSLSPKDDDGKFAAVIRYVRFSPATAESSGRELSNARGFLHQPADERRTPLPPPKEPVAG